MAKPAVFINPEGVLYEIVGNLGKIDHLSLISGSALAIRQLNEAGVFCCLISHPLGLAKGEYTLEYWKGFQKRLRRLLKKEAKAQIDAIYDCPYVSPSSSSFDPNFTRWSTARKPNTGLLITAAWEHDLDLKKSFMIGDEATDIDLAHNAGLKGILVKTQRGDQVLKGTFQHRTRPDHIALSLTDAIAWILKNYEL